VFAIKEALSVGIRAQAGDTAFTKKGMKVSLVHRASRTLPGLGAADGGDLGHVDFIPR